MKKVNGFTLYEMVIFIAVLAIMSSVLFFAYFTTCKNFNIAQREATLDEVASSCINRYFQLEQSDWTNEKLSSGEHTLTPSFCAISNDKFTVKAKITDKTTKVLNSNETEPAINIKNVVITVTENNPPSSTPLHNQQTITLVEEN